MPYLLWHSVSQFHPKDNPSHEVKLVQSTQIVTHLLWIFFIIFILMWLQILLCCLILYTNKTNPLFSLCQKSCDRLDLEIWIILTLTLEELCHNLQKCMRTLQFCFYNVMRLYLFVWPKSLLIVNYIIKSLYSMVKINLEYFHCITYSRTWWNDLETVVFI